jgi:hypothetical protein
MASTALDARVAPAARTVGAARTAAARRAAVPRAMPGAAASRTPALLGARRRTAALPPAAAGPRNNQPAGDDEDREAGGSKKQPSDVMTLIRGGEPCACARRCCFTRAHGRVRAPARGARRPHVQRLQRGHSEGAAQWHRARATAYPSCTLSACALCCAGAPHGAPVTRFGVDGVCAHGCGVCDHAGRAGHLQGIVAEQQRAAAGTHPHARGASQGALAVHRSAVPPAALC